MHRILLCIFFSSPFLLIFLRLKTNNTRSLHFSSVCGVCVCVLRTHVFVRFLLNHSLWFIPSIQGLSLNRDLIVFPRGWQTNSKPYISGTCDHVPSFWRGYWGLKLRYSAHAANTLTCWSVSSALSRQTLTYAIHTLTVDVTFQNLTYTDPTRAACAPSPSSCGSCLTVPPCFAHPLLEIKLSSHPG